MGITMFETKIAQIQHFVASALDADIGVIGSEFFGRVHGY